MAKAPMARAGTVMAAAPLFLVSSSLLSEESESESVELLGVDETLPESWILASLVPGAV